MGGKSKDRIATAPVLAVEATCATMPSNKLTMTDVIPLSCALWKNAAPRIDMDDIARPESMWNTIIIPKEVLLKTPIERIMAMTIHPGPYNKSKARWFEMIRAICGCQRTVFGIMQSKSCAM